MNASRRDIVWGSFAALGGVLVPSAAPVPNPHGVNVVFLFSDGFYDAEWAAQLRREAGGGHWREHSVSVLRPAGFAATSTMLAQARHYRVTGLLNDTDSLVIERLLTASGVQDMTVQRVSGRGLLLTASL